MVIVKQKAMFSLSFVQIKCFYFCFSFIKNVSLFTFFVCLKAKAQLRSRFFASCFLLSVFIFVSVSLFFEIILFFMLLKMHISLFAWKALSYYQSIFVFYFSFLKSKISML